MSEPTESVAAFGNASAHAKRYNRAALAVSLVFHVLLIAGLGIWIVQRQSRPDVADVAESPPAQSPAPPSRSAQPERSPDVTSNQVRNTLDHMREVHEAKPPEEKLTALEEKATKLEKLASEESVDEIAGLFHGWANTSTRASEPAAEPVAGEFDFDTAQLHEVRRTEAEDGAVTYHSVMVDAAGRTMEVEMTGSEGETAYQTMQTLKRFPLADRVYRQIAMPLIDQAAAAQKKKETATRADIADDEKKDPLAGEPDVAETGVESRGDAP